MPCHRERKPPLDAVNTSDNIIFCEVCLPSMGNTLSDRSLYRVNYF